MNKAVGIIGYGIMGSAIAERIKAKYYVAVFDIDKTKTKNVAGISVAKNSIDLIKDVGIVILAVKPQDFDNILNELKYYAKDKLIITIAAGITTKYIKARLPGARVIRAMPNLPAKVGSGIICLYKSESAADRDLVFCEELFKNLGRTLILRYEDMINVATAVSGSGPGFFYSLIGSLPETEWEEFGNKVFTPKLKLAAEQLGFSAQEAVIIAYSTTNGSIELLRETGSTPESLCREVASKGGTTEAGLEKLQGDIAHLSEAVEAAKKRAEELSKKE